MSRSDLQRLADIREAASRLEQIVRLGREVFESEWLVQHATERLLEIIGEATNAMTDDFRNSTVDIEWRTVINLRHRLAHHYHRVDPNQLWVIAAVEIPKFVNLLPQ